MSDRNSGLCNCTEVMIPRNVARKSHRIALPKKNSTGPHAEASIAARSAAGNSVARTAVVGRETDSAAIIVRARESNWTGAGGSKFQVPQAKEWPAPQEREPGRRR